MLARTISQSSVSTPVKATPTTIITVKMPLTVPVTAPAGATANTVAVPASKVVGSVTVKQEPIGIATTHTVQKLGVATTTTKTLQVGSLFSHISSIEHSCFGGVKQKLEIHLCSVFTGSSIRESS